MALKGRDILVLGGVAVAVVAIYRVKAGVEKVSKDIREDYQEFRENSIWENVIEGYQEASPLALLIGLGKKVFGGNDD